MAKQTFTTGQVLTAAQMTSLQANDYNWSVNAQTASYTLVAADAGKQVTMTNNVSATTITVNTALFTAGDTLRITNLGSQTCTVTAGTATVSTAGTLALIQYASGILYFSTAAAAIFFPDQTASSSPQFATFNETQTNGTDGGASVATTWTTRVLNTTVLNGIAGASLATNQVTLPAGTYVATVMSPYRNTNLTKIRLYNVTDASITAIGQNTNMDVTGAVGGVATLQAQFTIAASKTFAVQYYCQSGVASYGLGRAITAGTSEIYTSIQIQKIA